MASDAGFRAMFELSGIGMFQADSPSFRFTRVNQKFCRMLGYTAEELLRKTYIGLTVRQDRGRDMKQLARVVRGKTDLWSIEKRCRRQDGSAIMVRVDGTALRDDTAGVFRIMGMVSEVAAHKQIRGPRTFPAPSTRRRSERPKRSIKQLPRGSSQ